MGATTTPSIESANQPVSRPSRQHATTLRPGSSSNDVLDSDPSAVQLDSRLDSRFQSVQGTTRDTSAPGHQDACLSRHGTLLTSGATPLKRTVELKSLLGNANSRLPPGALVSQPPHGQATSLEQAKPRARVEIDIMLHSNICVEGGIFKGFIKLRIRPRTTKESAVSISDGKLRIIGFETVAGDHHEFFQYSVALSAVVTSPSRIYDSPPDSEGFCTAQEGVHKLEFEMQVPMGAVRCPKGPFHGPSGVSVRYIALASIKIKDEFNKRSIAHFYRDCEIWPRLNPSLILAPAEQPIQATTSKGLFMGGNGEVKLTAALHRSTFIAGSKVIVNLSVKNDTKKLIKSLTLILYRSTGVFKRKLPRDSNSVVELDIDASQTTTTTKSVANSTLEMAQGFPRSHASTAGWWAGIPSGERLNFSHFLLIPPDALTLSRGVLIEVEYIIRVSLNASLTTDVCVDLPIRIVNLLSLDPPPLPAVHAYPQNQTFITEPSPTLDVDYSSTLSASPDSNTQESDPPYTGDNENSEGFPESYFEKEPQHEVELGNLSMCDDAQDLVLHAIVSAQTQQTTQRPLEEHAEQDLESHEPSSPGRPELHCDSTHGRISRPSNLRGPSSFALRVQKKLELAAATPLVTTPALETEATTPTAPTAENPSMVGLGLALPSGSVISYQVASSNFLDHRYFDSGAVPRSNGAEFYSPQTGSRVLPKPAPVVGLPFREAPSDLSGLGIATFAAVDKRTGDSTTACSVEQIKEQHKPRRPPITPGMSSTGSVKDKIRELEERVRATEGY